MNPQLDRNKYATGALLNHILALATLAKIPSVDQFTPVHTVVPEAAGSIVFSGFQLSAVADRAAERIYLFGRHTNDAGLAKLGMTLMKLVNEGRYDQVIELVEAYCDENVGKYLASEGLASQRNTPPANLQFNGRRRRTMCDCCEAPLAPSDGEICEACMAGAPPRFTLSQILELPTIESFPGGEVKYRSGPWAVVLSRNNISRGGMYDIGVTVMRQCGKTGYWSDIDSYQPEIDMPGHRRGKLTQGVRLAQETCAECGEEIAVKRGVHNYVWMHADPATESRSDHHAVGTPRR